MKKVLTVLALSVISFSFFVPNVFAGCSDDGSVCGPHISSNKIRSYGYYRNPSNSYHYSYNDPWPRTRYQVCDSWGECSYYKKPWRLSGSQYNVNNYDNCGGGWGCGNNAQFQVNFQYQSQRYCDQWGCY